MDLYEYAEAIGAEVTVGYRHHRDPKERAYYADLRRGGSTAGVINGRFLSHGTCGGKTPEEALARYAKHIAGKTIQFGLSGHGGEFRVPPKLTFSGEQATA